VWQKLKQVIWQWRCIWTITPSITLIIILLRSTGLLQSWELAVYDQYLRLRPQQTRDDRIVIVGIDEYDINAIGQGIITDEVLAELLGKLKGMKPIAIGLDLYRDLPVEPGHEKLEEVFQNTDNIIGIEKVLGDSRREAVKAPPTLKAKGQVAANDVVLDKDNKVRRALLALTGENGKPIYSLGVYLALLYLDAEGVSPKIVPGTNNWWQLGETVLVPFASNDGSYVGADAGGYQVILNYRGGRGSFETVSLIDILEERVPPDWGRSRLILIGKVSESFGDVLVTPYTQNPSERMPGVEVHANIASQIISTALENRFLIKSWPESMEYVWIFLWAGFGAVIAWNGRENSFLYKGAILLVPSSVLLLITYTAFVQNWWIPVVPPILALGGAAIAITAYIARSAGQIRHTFGRYLSKEIVTTLLDHPEGLKLGGERRKITLLTSDLRGFTATSERLPPEEVVKILNFYLEYMADVITHYQGTIDEFMGDGILVLFGAPIAREDDAERAVACAVAMQLAMGSVNEQMKKWGIAPLEMGIGINTGEVVVGNIGSEKRTKYGVVGNQVNLTYRIESYTIGGQIIISETTLQEAGSIVKVDGERQVTPKGVKQPLTIYEVTGIGGKYNLYLPEEEEIFCNLPEEIAVQYSLLKGKDISKEIFFGTLVQLSAKGAVIKHNQEEVMILPPPLSNIKINMVSEGKLSEDIYAKVREKPAEKGSFFIRFTNRPPEIQSQLDNLYNSINQK